MTNNSFVAEVAFNSNAEEIVNYFFWVLNVVLL